MEQSEDRGARLKSVLGDRAIAWLAKNVGVAASTVHGYVNGKVPPADVALQICDVLGMDLRWYILGEGTTNPKGDRILSVPLLAADGSGAGELAFSSAFLSELGVPETGVRCMIAAGASMSPTIPEHAEVLFSVVPAEPADGAAYVIMIRERLVLRRLRFRSNGAMDTVCDNPAFRSETTDEVRQEQIVGRVLWVSHRPR